MRILELFSGSGSVGKVARAMGHDVVSLDMTPCGDYLPTVQADILQFDYTIWHRGYFDMIWASPPCQLYSVASARCHTAEERAARAEQGNAVTRRTREIIDYLQPKIGYAVENPLSSGLWKEEFFDGFEKKVVATANIPTGVIGEIQ